MNVEVIDSIIAKQKEKWRKISNDDPVKVPPHVVLVFEDVMGDEHIRDGLLDKLAGLARHYYCCIYILVQDPKIITPKVRQNADLAAFTYQTMERTIDSIYNDYAGIIGDKKEFRDMLNENTQDYHLVVVDQTKAQYRPEELFFCDAPELEVPDFRIGDKTFWRESGCNWEEQVKKFKKLPPNDSKYWEKQLKVRWKDEKKEEEEPEGESEERVTNNPDLAGPEMKVEHRERLIEKYKLKESNLQLANKTLSNLFSYRSGLDE